ESRRISYHVSLFGTTLDSRAQHPQDGTVECGRHQKVVFDLLSVEHPRKLQIHSQTLHDVGDLLVAVIITVIDGADHQRGAKSLSNTGGEKCDPLPRSKPP